MSDLEESIETSLKSLKEYEEANKDIKPFIKDLDMYKSELDTINFSLEIINDELRSYDLIDYLYTKLNYNLVSLSVVNKLIQQVKICKSEIQDPDYLNKADEIYSFLMKEGYNFISKKPVDLLCMNNDFTIFTNLTSDKQVKQTILWQRSQECLRKRSYYEGDLNVFYRMMIKQECFIWAKLFYKDFSNTLSNIRKKKFTLYERFLYSVLLPFLENEMEIEVVFREEREISVEDFINSVEVQDYVYDVILEKCYTEFNGDNERRKNVMDI